ncbi:helicase [Marinilabiliaceae bacterium JC017]|nr:helicase [Marinilabiliaceae bacterium JC017]
MAQNPQLQLAYNFIQYTNRNVFLTGKAGTGKTTFLHTLKQNLPKRMIVVAPTGVAAINAGGVTIHSFFQMPFGPIIPSDAVANEAHITSKRIDSNVKKFSRQKINIIKSLDLLVIDEISMVRADLLDGIDEVLRRFKDPSLPFGGTQLLLIGDMQQLPPVIKDEEWNLLRNYYSTGFFFGSRALQKSNYISIELQHIYRQSDSSFITILNEIRESKLSRQSLEALNKRYRPQFEPSSDEGYITLTTHNSRANSINQQKLVQLKGKSHFFKAEVANDFPEYTFPTEARLELKSGAQVMFVKNDPSPEKEFYNGKIGIITGFDDDTIYVRCPDSSIPIEVAPIEWVNTKYTIDENTKEINETIIGTFKQYPLKLAWAITIHKSQGLTFEKAIIDANAAFAHGQTYVALSRCKTLEGLVLSTRISEEGIICDRMVANFNDDIHQNQPDNTTLLQSKRSYEYSLLTELFNFDTILRSLNRCDRSIYENEKLLMGNILNQVTIIKTRLQQELVGVSQKFNPQLQYLFQQSNTIETNHPLQERIKKAAVYFSEKTQSILLDTLDQTSFSTDNQAVRKTIKERLNQLTELAAIKHECLTACLHGFETRDYLSARAKAHIQAPAKKRSTTDEPDIDTVKYPKLFHQLRTWRKGVADEADKPAFWVASQKVLVQITNQLPLNFLVLRNIKGIGKKKLNEFGPQILAIVNDFVLTNNLMETARKLNDQAEEIQSTSTKNKADKKPTQEVSYELFKEGQSIEAIARQRSLQPTTIESHLARYIETGELEIHQFVSKEKLDAITQFFKKNDNMKLNDAKQYFGNKVSYADLKFVQKHFLFMRKTKG